MFVATNRQKKNIFAERAERLRQESEDQAAVNEPEPPAPREPAEVAEQMPDLQALREAAQRAADLVHADAPKTVAPETTPEPEPKSRPGRKPSDAVKERTATALRLVIEAGAEGTTKPQLAEAMGEKEQQVYTSLQKLQREGKVQSKHLDGIGYRWIAL